MKTANLADCVTYACSSVSIHVEICVSDSAEHSFAVHVPNGGKAAFKMPELLKIHAAFRPRSFVRSTYMPLDSNEARGHLHSSANIRAGPGKNSHHSRAGRCVHPHTKRKCTHMLRDDGKRVMCGTVVEKDRRKAVSCTERSAMHECLHLQRMLSTHDELQGRLLFQISGYIKM